MDDRIGQLWVDHPRGGEAQKIRKAASGLAALRGKCPGSYQHHQPSRERHPSSVSNDELTQLSVSSSEIDRQRKIGRRCVDAVIVL